MEEPPIPRDEAERLAALRDLEILDTPAEERFDRITRIAKHLFGVPIALISLVDKNRQWFKSRQGLDAPETPRNISFCGHAIVDREIFCIPDASQDKRFSDNPLVTAAPDIRFYAGAPLEVSGGHRIGTLCIIDQQPHDFTASDLQALRDLADWVQDEINTVKLNEAIDIIRHHEGRLHTILNTVLDGILTLDEKGNVLSANPAIEKIFARHASQLKGKNIHALIPAIDAANLNQYITKNQYLSSDNQKTNSFEMEAIGQDGNAIPIELLISATEVAGAKVLVCVIRDISDRKRIEKIKNEFISCVSHELRTPLTAIRGALGLVNSGNMGEVSQQAKSLLEIADNNSQRLVRLVNDILDLDKIHSGKMKFNISSYSISPLIKEAISANQGFAAERNINIKIKDKLPEVLAKIDPDRFIQVMTNLLSNAIKFSTENEEVEVDMSISNNKIHITITDSGAGIPAEFHERVFERFSQADNSDDRQIGGTGLGLSIAKAIVEQLRGEIGFDKTRTKGCQFYVELPLFDESHPMYAQE